MRTRHIPYHQTDEFNSKIQGTTLFAHRSRSAKGPFSTSRTDRIRTSGSPLFRQTPCSSTVQTFESRPTRPCLCSRLSAFTNTANTYYFYLTTTTNATQLSAGSYLSIAPVDDLYVFNTSVVVPSTGVVPFYRTFTISPVPSPS
jgi:hypothetical protein